MYIRVCPAENAPLPRVLWTAEAIPRLLRALKAELLEGYQLNCIKVAVKWPHQNSPLGEMLGKLTGLGNIEVLGFHWRGLNRKVHNADYVLEQASLNHSLFQSLFRSLLRSRPSAQFIQECAESARTNTKLPSFFGLPALLGQI